MRSTAVSNIRLLLAVTTLSLTYRRSVTLVAKAGMYEREGGGGIGGTCSVPRLSS